MDSHSDKILTGVAWSGLIGSITLANVNLWLGVFCSIGGLVATGFAIRASIGKMRFYRAEIAKLSTSCKFTPPPRQ